MTITTLEEHEEAAQQQSEPSSPVIGLNGGQQEIIDPTDLFLEMKFEMRATKGALSSPMHDRLKTGLPTTLNTSSIRPFLPHGHLPNADHLSGGIARSQPASTATSAPGQQNGPRHQQALLSKSSSTLPEHLSNRLHRTEAAQSSRPVYAAARSVSKDTVDSTSALSARTRLRRQRRMGSQDSTEQSEDPMERLNRLRARISGALSEVKGVLTKYSTEAEPNDEVTQKDLTLNTQASTDEQPKTDSGPIQFRFVKKVRRRSLFNDDEEDKNKGNTAEQKNDKREATPGPSIITIPPIAEQIEIVKAEETVAEPKEKISEDPSKTEKATAVLSEKVIPNVETPALEAESSKTPLNDKKDKEKLKPHKKLTIEVNNEKRRVSIGTVEEVDSQHIPQTMKSQRRPSDSVAFIKKLSKNDVKSVRTSDKVSENASRKPRNGKTETKTDAGAKPEEKPLITMEAAICPKDSSNNLPSAVRPAQTESKEATKLGAENSVKQHPKKLSADSTQTVQKTSGKCLSIKRSDSLRRSSIAAVEGSKIEPPVQESMSPNLKTQRRPSDSEALIRKTVVSSIEKRAGKPLVEIKLTKAKTNGNCRTQIKRSSAEKSIERPSSALAEPLVEKHTQSPTANIENRRKDGATTSSALDKQAVVMPNQSIEVINNEASITSSVPDGTSLATVIGSATTADTENAPPAKSTETYAASNDTKSPLIADGLEIANVEVPISLSQLNEESSQQAQLNHKPILDSTRSTSAVSLDKSIPPSTDNTVNKSEDPKRGASTDQAHIPLPAASANDAINHATTTEEASIGSDRTPTRAAPKDVDIKKPIHQQEIIPVAFQPSSQSHSHSPSSSSPLLSLPTVQEPLQQASSQQVSVSAELAAIATADDICVHDRVPEIFETTPKKSLSEVNEAASSEIAIAVTTRESSTGVVATKTSAAASTPHSGVENIATSTEAETKKIEIMPELQVLPAHVKALQIHSASQVPPPFGESKDVFPKKKTGLKKVIRKSCTEKQQQQTKPATEKDQPEETKEPAAEAEVLPVLESTVDEATESAEEEQHTAKPKSTRTVKKKVIIKRLQRRLSGSDLTFFLGAKDENSTSTTDVETLEKAIAYVTDDEEDEEPTHPIQPVKSCMRVREYQVGDWVMYAERYKKTQLRWKRGRVVERITSISYKVDIDGKEVSAHINYLKRYTGRKVRFGGKEYLEIDYEQIAEEEQKSRSYSIWNLV